MFRCIKPSISSINFICRCFVSPVRFAQTAVAPQQDDKFSYIQKFQEHSVQIKTCGNLYKEWNKKNLYRSVPDGDLQFTVRYIDTSKNHSAINEEAPTILALHGAPGSYEDYSRLTSFMTERGFRVIAPCFPDFTHYPPGVFRHTVSERVQFLTDFLEAIGVSYVDLLVCHSSAVYPSLQLCIRNAKPTITGLALFNPGSFHTTASGVQPWFLLKNLVKLVEYPVGLKLYLTIGPSVLKMAQTPVRIDHPLDPLLSATVMVNGDIKQSRSSYYQLSSRKFPIFLAFAEDDKMINKELSYKIAYALGVQDPQISHYNEQGILDKQGKVIGNTQVIAFEKGSHYTFSKHSEIVNEELLNFTKKYVL